MAETSTKPYLIRAIHEWCSDNGFTPYIAVAVDGRTTVPREFVRNGEIVLNVSVMATHRLQLGNELIEFQARFGGTPRELSIPVENVSAIYARENGHGMAFDVPKAGAVTDADAPTDAPASAGAKDAATASDGQDDVAGDKPQPDAPRAVTSRSRPRGALRSTRSDPAPASRPPQLVSVPAEPASPAAGDAGSSGNTPDDDPPDPTDNPPQKSRPKLTRVK